MRRFVGVLFCFLWAAIASLQGAEFRLLNGEVIRGEPASYNDDGLVVRLELGGFSPRIGWGKLTQESLKQLEAIPEAKPFVEPYIEVPIEIKQKEREKKKEIVVKEPPRVELPAGKPRFFASLGNPLGLFLLGVLYLANLYAAVEVARFRGHSVPVVVGVSAVVPVFGPAIFTAVPGHGVGSTYEVPVESSTPEAAAPAAAPAGAASGLGLAAHGQPAKSAASNYSQVYNRQNTTFDRRFFETKFTGFFRVVPSEAEKDLVLVIKGAKAEYIAKRISRISAAEMHLQLQRGNEVSIPFGEIVEVTVRHKDAK